MDEIFGVILIAIAEFLGELLAELIAEVVVAVIVRFFRKIVERSLAIPSMFAVPAYFILGCAFGFLSVLLLPHPIVRPSRIHGINLLISPVATGLVMAFLGWELRRREKQAVRIESFKYGFTFALGMAVIRLVFAR